MEGSIDDANESLKELSSANGLAPAPRAVALNNIGVVYLMGHRFDRAEDCLAGAVAIVNRTPIPSAPEILANVALLLRKTGRRQEAKAAQLRSQELASQRTRTSMAQTVDASELNAFGR